MSRSPKVLFILFFIIIMSSCSFQKDNAGTVKTINIGNKVQEPNALFDLNSGHDLLESIRVKAILPLIPHANAISGEIPFGEGSEPRVDHLYSTKQSYEIKEDREMVKVWTKQHFTENGFIEVEFGNAGSTKDSEKTDSFTFQYHDDPNFTISASFAKHNNNTLMEYTLNYVYVPQRSDESKILEHVEKISLSFGKLDQTPQAFEIKNQVTIGTIVKQYNELPYSAGGIHSCQMDDGTRLNIEFTLADGRKIKKVENPACSDIFIDPNFGLYDKMLTLFNYLKTLLPSSGTS